MYIRTQRALVVGVLVKFKEKLKVVKITKDMAAFIRKRLPEACIKKTLKNKGSSMGSYYAEETSAVLKLLAQYQKTVNVVSEYPTRK